MSENDDDAVDGAGRASHGGDDSADFDLSPEEASALYWAKLDEKSQNSRREGAQKLAAFIDGPARAFRTPQGDHTTNVCRQDGGMWALPPPELGELLRLLEACRREGSTMHFCERQAAAGYLHSGLMIDYDIKLKARPPPLDARQLQQVAAAVAARLQRDVDWGAARRVDEPAGKARFHIFIITKPAPTPLAGGAWKYGLHVLVPGVRLPVPYKKWLMREFRSEPAVLAVMRELGADGNPADCLDLQSGSVPVLFFGSCKNAAGAVPYDLAAAYEVAIDFAPTTVDYVAPPFLCQLTPAQLAPLCLAGELALVAESPDAPLVRKRDYKPRDEIMSTALAYCERAPAGAAQLAGAQSELAQLTLRDHAARELHALLDLLPPDFYQARNRWRDVVYAIANTSEEYRPLALWFSQRCRHRSRPAESRAGDLPAMWDEAVARRGAAGASARPLTARSVAFWARQANPERAAAAARQTCFVIASEFAYEHQGRLEHSMIAAVLRAMVGSKFVADVEGDGRSYAWYEFVMPDEPMRPGEVWKWRKEATPESLHLCLSERVPAVLRDVARHFEGKRAAARDEQEAKHFGSIVKNLHKSIASLFNHNFKVNAVAQAAFLFRRRGFAESLDLNPELFGCLNGVLRLGARCELVACFHEWPVSRFAPVHWKPFDPEDPWVRIVLDMVAAIIPEPDARDFILFHASQGLSCKPKEGVMLMIPGGGQNGKTALMRGIAKSLGPVAEKFNIQLMCSEREDADRPNSAVMRFKYLNYAYAEESNRAQTLNVARMKEMVAAGGGEVSGRDLNSKQETFDMRANIVVASQYSFIVDTTDHGTWRRLRYYKAKTKFRRHPDPNDPFERQEDQRYARQYVTDPQFRTAMLSVLSHYYERLENEYGGELTAVPCPTIEAETQAFRLEQDSLHRWICESVVVSRDFAQDYPLSVLSSLYSEWYTRNIDRKRHVASDTIVELQMSVLSKYTKLAPNRSTVLRGCRVLTPDAPELRDGEELLCEVEQRGKHSAADWSMMKAAAAPVSGNGVAADGLPWWAARSGGGSSGGSGSSSGSSGSGTSGGSSSGSGSGGSAAAGDDESAAADFEAATRWRAADAARQHGAAEARLEAAAVRLDAAVAAITADGRAVDDMFNELYGTAAPSAAEAVAAP